MAEDETYNSSTDNVEKKESPRINPATGISNFVQAPKSESAVRQLDEMRKKELDKRERQLSRKETKTNIPTRENKPKTTAEIFGVSRKELMKKLIVKRGKRPIGDKIKVMRLQNMLDKKRLQNQIEKFKLQRRVEILRKKGKLGEVIARPMITSKPLLYPAYATPEVMGDIDSAFNSDINPSNNDFYGKESYYGGEDYYQEQFFHDELNLSPWEHLNIKPKPNVSALLW